jgi:hypothetical protein
MEIPIHQLKAVSTKLFGYLEAQGNDSVSIDEDYYWEVSDEDRYVVEKTPELVVGQLSEDWEFLQKLLEPDREPLSYHFVWMGKLCAAIGESIGHDTPQQ